MRGPPLQTRVVAAYGTVSQLANMLSNDSGAHGMEQGKANRIERGKLMRAVGMAGKEWQANKKPAEQGNCRRTQPADSPPGTGLETNSQQLAGLAAKTTAADDVGRPLAVQCR